MFLDLPQVEIDDGDREEEVQDEPLDPIAEKRASYLRDSNEMKTIFENNSICVKRTWE